MNPPRLALSVLALIAGALISLPGQSGMRAGPVDVVLLVPVDRFYSYGASLLDREHRAASARRPPS